MVGLVSRWLCEASPIRSIPIKSFVPDYVVCGSRKEEERREEKERGEKGP